MTNGDLEITLLFSHNVHIPTLILLTIYGLSYLFFHKKVMKGTAYGFRDEKYFRLPLFALHDCRITRNVG